MLLEIGIVILLSLVNGLLAMSELAIVSARRTRLQVLADQGSTRAATALRLAGDPGRFLSSVQIGITLVGVLNGAFSGATLGARLAGVLAEAGVPPALAQPLGVGSVVVAITFLSLIVGELVPKQIALRAPETVATRVAPLMQAISRGAAPLVWILNMSGKAILRLLGQTGATVNEVTEDELRLIIAEAEASGVLGREEGRMIESVMRVADRSARALMTPRKAVEAVDVTSDRDTVLRRFHATHRSRLLVRDPATGAVLGLVKSRDMLNPDRNAAEFDLRRKLHKVPVVRADQDALEVIHCLRAAPAHMAMVMDHAGRLEGIITPMDLLEAITGSFADHADEPKVAARADGSLLVAGWMPAPEFADLLGLPGTETKGHLTAAGHVRDVAGQDPALGETVVIGDWTVEIVDIDGDRIDKLLVTRRRHA